MTIPAPPPQDTKSQLRKTMGFWDVLLFNIATVLGPRWIAAAGHNGTSSISLWVIAAVFFFVPGALVINELSSRFPEEGGLYAWSKEAFGDFHGFVAGWTYWIYTVFYFPGLLLASASMAAYIIGGRGAQLAQDRTFLLSVSLGLLLVAVILNIIGLNIGKWLQNAGGVGTYVPLLILALVAVIVVFKRGSATHFTVQNMLPAWNWNTVNFWSQIAFAFTGLELVSAMSEEVRDPRRTLPRAVFGAGALIALMYIGGTFAILALLPAASIDPQSGVFSAITAGSMVLKIGLLGVLAAMLVTVGNAGGVGSTVAGIARVPFVVGIDRYLPAAFGKIHPKWKTPYISILVQAVLSGTILVLSQIQSKSILVGYQLVVSAAIILYFIPFLYMFAAVIRLSTRKDRRENSHAVLVPGGVAGVWICGSLGFLVVLIGIILSFFPPGETTTASFELQLVGGTAASILIGLFLYWRGARSKKAV
ncbi:APC family permease [Telmatobacter sp. DSM 110680]|uniref:APC family permease n=1 Tax=Telmatobacter sp. DSM 110680 TaxID=3036704 RepID=A0AAU7DK94_9BACT